MGENESLELDRKHLSAKREELQASLEAKETERNAFAQQALVLQEKISRVDEIEDRLVAAELERNELAQETLAQRAEQEEAIKQLLDQSEALKVGAGVVDSLSLS